MFCGYACVVYATRGDFDTAAVFIGIAMVARHAGRLFRAPDELASPRSAWSSIRSPTSSRSAWRRRSWRSHGDSGRSARLGWAAGFIYVTAAAMRLARFNIQTDDGSRQALLRGMPSPAAGGVMASTVFLYPWGLQDPRVAALRAADGAGAGAPDGQHDPLPQHQGDRRRLAPFVSRALLRARSRSPSSPRTRASRWS